MKKSDFKIGQFLYSEDDNGIIKEHEISEIGKKYLRFKNDHWTKVLIEELVSVVEFGSCKKFYLSKEIILENREKKKMFRLIEKRIAAYGSHEDYSLESVKKIMEILNLKYD